MGTGSFPGVKWGRGVLTPFYCRGHGRVELYLYPPSGPHRACKRITLPLIYLALNGTAEHLGRYGVLIHDPNPDVRLFHSLLRGDFPSR